jgi:hypothetical protein
MKMCTTPGSVQTAAMIFTVITGMMVSRVATVVPMKGRLTSNVGTSLLPGTRASGHLDVVIRLWWLNFSLDSEILFWQSNSTNQKGDKMKLNTGQGCK